MNARTGILALICLVTSWLYAFSIASLGGAGLKPGQVNDFFDLWNQTRAVLHHHDPYSKEVALQNQIAAYGATAQAVGIINERGFTYPIQATFPLLPLAFLDFPFADKIALCVMAAFTALSIRWLRGKWGGRTILYVIFAFASYPVIVALQMRQPTLIFFGFIVASFALLRSGRLASAGVLAGLACAKPQVAMPVLLPMLVWAAATWRARWGFVAAFMTSLLSLLALGHTVNPGWFSEWLSALKGYSQFVHPSVIVFILGSKAGLLVSVVLLVVLTVILWLGRDRDLVFQMAFSVAVFSLLIQSELYNAVMLLIPAVWVADNAQLIRESGSFNQLALAIVRVALVELWLAAGLGAVLVHKTALGNTIAFWISTNMVLPVIWSLIAMMMVQRFSSAANNGKVRAFGTASTAC